MNSSRQTKVMVLGLAAATLVAYANSFDGQYFLDDYGCIVGNDSLGQLWPATEEVPHGLQRRPVGRLSLWLNYQVGGLEIFGYHALNFMIHLAAGLLLFDLVRRTLRLPDIDERWRDRAEPFAFAVALLWLVHPLQTESVTYIVQRLESLVSLCYLGCLYGVLRGATERRTGWYIVAVTCFWLGVGTKEIIVTAPLVTLLFDRAYLAASWRELCGRRWGFYATMAPLVIWLAWVLAGGSSGDGKVSAGFDLEGTTPWQYLMTQAGVILHYLRLSLVPVGQCLDYDWPTVHNWREAILPGALVLAMLTACGLAWKSSPRLSFLGLAFFLILAPTSSIMPIKDAAFEHRMYLPLAPLLALLVVGGWRLCDRQLKLPRLASWAWGLVVCLFIVGTIDRNSLYCDSVAMWQDVLRTSPHNARAHCNLGSAYCRDWQFDEGKPHLRQAVELDPSDQSYQFRLEKTQMLLKRRSEQGAG